MWECCVPGCSSGKECQSNIWKGKVTMYSFPRAWEERKKWLDAIGVKIDMYRISKSKVCSLHFLPKDLVKIHEVRTPMLRQGALPKVCLDGPIEEEMLEAARPRDQWNVQDKNEDEIDVPICVVKGCHNDVMDLAAGVAFFRFPKVKEHLVHWADTLGHPADWRPPSLARLCCQHFDPLVSMGGSLGDSKPPGQSVQDPLISTEEQIRLIRPWQKGEFWKNIKEYYDQGHYCDLRIICLSENFANVEEAKNDNGVMCHRLVLASMSPMIAAATLSASNDEVLVLYTLGHDAATVKLAVDTLYACLAQEKEMEELINGETGRVFSDLGVTWKSFKIMQSESRQIQFEHNYNHGDNVLGNTWDQGNDNDMSEASEIEDSDWVKKEEIGDDSEVVECALAEEDISKPRKRKTTTFAKFTSSKRCKITLEDLKIMHEQLVKEQGMISVDLVPEPFNAKGYSIRYCYDMMVMLGLQQTDKGQCYYNAIPLAVSPKAGEQVTAEDIKKYYNRFQSASKTVFGLSQVEVTSAQICHRMGLSRNGACTFPKKKYEYKRIYANHSKEELENLLSEEVVSANKTGPIKPKFYEGLINANEDLVTSDMKLHLCLTSDVPSNSDLEGIIVLTGKESGGVLAHAMSVNNDSREKDINDLIKVFFDTFTIHDRDGTPKLSTVPKVDSLVEEAKDNAKLQALYCVVQDFLKGDRDMIKELSGLGHKVCDNCGQEFMIENMNDMNNYRQHRRKHFYDDFICECGIEFQNCEERRSHIQLVHLKGYTMCSDCTFVGNKRFMREHFEDRHEEFTCANCGKTIQGKVNLNIHVENMCETVVFGPNDIKDGKYYSAKLINYYKSYTCDCNMHFMDLGEKKKHVQLVHMKGYKECPECDCIVRHSFLPDHIRKHHEEICCEKCGVNTKGTIAFSHHMRIQHDVKVALKSAAIAKKSDTMINSRFINLSNFHPHPNTSEVPHKTGPCVDCGKIFESPRQLYVHWTDHHRESKCLECDIKCVGDHKRRLHTRKYHTEKKDGDSEVATCICQKRGCEECRKTPTHFKIMHGSGKREEEKAVYLCKECNMTFKKIGSLTRHRRRMHGIGEGCMCSDCGKTYNTAEQLKAHIACMHREMKCDKCGIKVSGWQGRNIHNRNFHPTGKGVKVNCPDCGKTLANDRQLQAHRYSKHIPESQWPVPCPHCDRRFANHSRLWAHNNRAHSTTRQFVCRYEGCNSDYKEQSDRIGHEIKKHGMSFSKYQKQLLGEST